MTFLIILHFLISLFLIGAILLQVGKGASMGASFGGGVPTLFGPSGQATPLGKLIVGLAILFICLTLLIGTLSLGGRIPQVEPKSFPSQEKAPSK